MPSASIATPLLTTTPLQSGRYYMIPGVTATNTNGALGTGTCRAIPFYVPNLVTISRIGAECTSAGDAGSKYRLGIWNDDGTGRPGTLLIDAGTIAGDSATVQEIVISQSVAPGLYWASGTVQVVTVTQPTMRINATGPIILGDYGTSTPSANMQVFARTMSGQTGALTSPWVEAGTSALPPRIFVKIA
jgi:hypothetical protein